MAYERLGRARTIAEAAERLKGATEGPFLVLAWSANDKLTAFTNIDPKDVDGEVDPIIDLLALSTRFSADLVSGWFDAELPDGSHKEKT